MQLLPVLGMGSSVVFFFMPPPPFMRIMGVLMLVSTVAMVVAQFLTGHFRRKRPRRAFDDDLAHRRINPSLEAGRGGSSERGDPSRQPGVRTSPMGRRSYLQPPPPSR